MGAEVTEESGVDDWNSGAEHKGGIGGGGAVGGAGGAGADQAVV